MEALDQLRNDFLFWSQTKSSLSISVPLGRSGGAGYAYCNRLFPCPTQWYSFGLNDTGEAFAGV